MRKLAERTHKQVRDLFTYKPDKEQFPDYFDHWKSYADEVEAGQPFSDDCDSFSLSCAELLIRQGADPTKITIAGCRTETGGKHLVCIADGWLLDNRHVFVVRWDSVGYEWIKAMRMDEPGIWRKL